MRFQAPYLRAIINEEHDEGTTGNYEVMVGIFSSEEPSPDTMLEWRNERGIPSKRMARMVIMSIVKDYGHTMVNWEEV
jgi:hypothetical protein